MPFAPLDHQVKALKRLKSGSILTGVVGSGKTWVSLAYFVERECLGGPQNGTQSLLDPLQRPMDLYVITTAKKRDLGEWEDEAVNFGILTDSEKSRGGIKLTVDSWNNIAKYVDVKNAFFIFDEQRLVGWGAWTAAFLKIAKGNRWIMLSATPADGWMDYIGVFVANGFYRNKTDFTNRHCVYSRFAKYPKVERFLDIERLEYFKRQILVPMPFKRHTKRHSKFVTVGYDREKYDKIVKKRWNVYEEEPIQDIGQLCLLARRCSNESEERVAKVRELLDQHPRLIVFYNFNFELNALRDMAETLPDDWAVAEWNGHKHEVIPDTEKWVYLVQYTAGAEGWNCISTDTIVFFSLNYSYRITEQAMGRIDRMNTPFTDLNYYYIRTMASIDAQILKCLGNKKNFNARMFAT